jgi:hypothetical protein
MTTPDAFDAPGVWWRADRPGDRLGGTLKYRVDAGAELAVIGVLADLPSLQPGRDDSVVIHGMLPSTPPGCPGAFVSLVPAFRVSVSLGNVPAERYMAQRAFIGERNVDERATFGTLAMSLPELVGWWPETTIRIEAHTDGTGIRIDLGPASELEFDLENQHVRMSAHGLLERRRATAEVTETVMVSVTAPAPVAFDAFEQQWLRPLRYLVSFVTGATGRPEYADLLSDGAVVRLLPKQPGPVSPARGSSSILPRPAALAGIEALVRAWFKLFRQRGRFFDAWLGGASSPFQNVEPRLLLLLEAVRLYMRAGSDADGVRALIAAAPRVLDEVIADRRKFAEQFGTIRDQIWLDERPGLALLHGQMARVDWALRTSVMAELGVDPDLVRANPSFSMLKRSR